MFQTILIFLLKWLIILFLAGTITAGIFFIFIGFEEAVTPSHFRRYAIQYSVGVIVILFILIRHMWARAPRTKLRQKPKGPLQKAKEARIKFRTSRPSPSQSKK